jgi:hypothetical protein
VLLRNEANIYPVIMDLGNNGGSFTTEISSFLERAAGDGGGRQSRRMFNTRDLARLENGIGRGVPAPTN